MRSRHHWKKESGALVFEEREGQHIFERREQHKDDRRDPGNERDRHAVCVHDVDVCAEVCEYAHHADVHAETDAHRDLLIGQCVCVSLYCILYLITKELWKYAPADGKLLFCCFVQYIPLQRICF